MPGLGLTGLIFFFCFLEASYPRSRLLFFVGRRLLEILLIVVARTGRIACRRLAGSLVRALSSKSTNLRLLTVAQQSLTTNNQRHTQTAKRNLSRITPSSGHKYTRIKKGQAKILEKWGQIANRQRTYFRKRCFSRLLVLVPPDEVKCCCCHFGVRRAFLNANFYS